MRGEEEQRRRGSWSRYFSSANMRHTLSSFVWGGCCMHMKSCTLMISRCTIHLVCNTHRANSSRCCILCGWDLLHCFAVGCFFGWSCGCDTLVCWFSCQHSCCVDAHRMIRRQSCATSMLSGLKYCATSIPKRTWWSLHPAHAQTAYSYRVYTKEPGGGVSRLSALMKQWAVKWKA